MQKLFKKSLEALFTYWALKEDKKLSETHTNMLAFKQWLELVDLKVVITIIYFVF